MPKSAKPVGVEKLLEGAKKKMASGGLTDETAKACICAGLFVVVSDLSFRGVDLAKNLSESAFKDLTEASQAITSLPSSQGVVDGLLSIARDRGKENPLGTFRAIGDVYKSITTGYSSIKEKLEKAGTLTMPNLDTTGLWDFRITCMGFGVLTAGVALLFANHPDWVTDTIKEAGAIHREAMAANLEMLKSTQGMEKEMFKEASKLLDLKGLAKGVVVPK